MLKKEILWREILNQVVEKRITQFTQKDLAGRLSVSLSTVFNSLKIPRQVGAVRVTGRNFEVQDTQKFLYLWATQRNLEKGILYRTHVDSSPKEIEGLVPPSAMFACYSAYAMKYGEAPADYDAVYLYANANGLREIKKRFPPNKRGQPNVIVLKSDAHLCAFGPITPDVQTFVDLWNLKEWYAKEFTNALLRKIFNTAT